MIRACSGSGYSKDELFRTLNDFFAITRSRCGKPI